MSLLWRKKKSSDPFFSVVIATYGRDQCIIPTLESVANQKFKDFEVLVVSDGPASGVLKGVVENFGHQFSLHSLSQRTRSQSGPNNLGWEAAHGKYIAYLGHDDIWSTEHLSYLAQAYNANKSLDFVVSGCIYFGPAGTDDQLTWITGLIDTHDKLAARKHFLPPSSLSHRRSLSLAVPRWSEPMSTRRPVDTEFVVGAAEKGCVFASTGRISVYKFASAQRYLSYLCPDDSEQRHLLELMKKEAEFDDYIEERVNASKLNNLYMKPQHATIDMFTPGQKVLENEVVRGIKLPPVNPLKAPQQIEAGNDKRGYDWHAPEVVDGKNVRWSGPNHHPRIILPYSSEGLVLVSIRVLAFASDEVQKTLKILLNGREVDFQISAHQNGFILSFLSNLNHTTLSILEFRMHRTVRPADNDSRNSDLRKLGICLSGIELRPQTL